MDNINLGKLSRKQQIELLEQYEEKAIEIIDLVKNLTKGIEKLVSLDEVEKYVHMFKDVKTFSDKYFSELSDIA